MIIAAMLSRKQPTTRSKRLTISRNTQGLSDSAHDELAGEERHLRYREQPRHHVGRRDQDEHDPRRDPAPEERRRKSRHRSSRVTRNPTSAA